MKAFILLGFIICSASSWAQQSANTSNLGNLGNAVANTIVASLYTTKKDNGLSDVFSGICTFNGSSCNGAQVTLFLDNNQIYNTVLTGTGKFAIPKLKPHQSYVLKLSWPKYKVDETRTVEAGQFITINLSK